MDQQGIETKVIEVLAVEFGMEKSELNASMGPEDIENWDSMTHVSLTASLEEAFEINFEIEEVMEMENITAIIEIINRKTAA